VQWLCAEAVGDEAQKAWRVSKPSRRAYEMAVPCSSAKGTESAGMLVPDRATTCVSSPTSPRESCLFIHALKRVPVMWTRPRPVKKG